MILQPCNVELTKVHYYDRSRNGRNVSSIPTISREVWENTFNKNVVIKKNIFGHRWVLKINQTEDDVKKRGKVWLVVYVLVFCSIIVAVGFGIYYSLEKNMFTTTTHKIIHLHPEETNSTNYFYKTHENQILPVTSTIPPNENTTTNKRSDINDLICPHCNPRLEVCLKVMEIDKPNCVKIKDTNDPTGCGGLCPINTHFCHVLDITQKVYQCSILRNTLKCPNGSFNCGNRCISQHQRCDGIVDCSNFLDEKNCDCNVTTHFQCNDMTSCFELSHKCDKKVDCWDKSDELNCNEDITCQEDEIWCQNGHCIPKTKFCDGAYDCLDKSDEPEGCEA